jgi:gas vesicle protein
MSFEQDCIETKIDVGVLKEQVRTLTTLCDKMDKVIERLADNHDRMVNQIYDDMDKRKEDTNENIKELHSRITTVDRNLSDRLELTERRLMEEIKELRKDISDHNQKEDGQIQKILEWKWMGAGGIVVVAWLLSHVHFSIIEKLLN